VKTASVQDVRESSDSHRAYLDWNASAPLRPAARDAMLAALEEFGNPSSVHREGQRARALVESSRDQVAAFLGCDPADVVFTSGGTEANDLALHLLAAAAPQRAFAASRIEHASVLRPLEARETAAWRAVWLPAGADGRVLGGSLPTEGLGFGVLQAANHETGAAQPLEAAVERWSAAGLAWHCDAAQAWGRVPLSMAELGCTTASLSGHKLGAPKGVGALFVRRGTAGPGRLLGGPQERGLRAGTENLPGIAALAAACAVAATDRESDAAWCAGLRDRLRAGALAAHELARVNGPGPGQACLPNTVNLSFPGIPGERLVQALDLEGVAVSAGAACASGASEPSPVLRAMGLPEWQVASAVRVSLGPTTRAEEVERFLTALVRVLPRLRGSSG